MQLFGVVSYQLYLAVSAHLLNEITFFNIFSLLGDWDYCLLLSVSTVMIPFVEILLLTSFLFTLVGGV